MKTRTHKTAQSHTTMRISPCGVLLSAAILMVVPVRTVLGLEPTERTVDVAKGTPGNPVGVGYDRRDETVPLKIRLTTSKGTIATASPYIDEGDIWDTDGQWAYKTPSIKPGEPFAIKFKGTLTLPYQGSGSRGNNKWDTAVGDLDMDADTDNNAGADNRPPSLSEDEDKWEYMGEGVTDDVVGLLTPLDDDHDISKATSGTWRRDYNNTWNPTLNPDLLAVTVTGHARATSQLYLTGNADISVCTGDGTPAPSWGTKETITVPANMTSGDKVTVERQYYAQGRSPSLAVRILWLNMEPENKNSALETTCDAIRAFVIQTDLDVDGDNNGIVSGTNDESYGEDFNEERSDLPGMCLVVDHTDTDSDGVEDNGWNGETWGGMPEATSVESYSVMKPGTLRSLYLPLDALGAITAQHTNIDIRVYKRSGTGAVRVFSRETDPQNARLLLTAKNDGDWSKKAGDDTLWGIVSAYRLTAPYWRDLDLAFEGLKPGRVELGVQLVVDGLIIHEDVVAVTVVGVCVTPCDDSWLPKGGAEDNETTFTATVYPSTSPATVRYTLYDVAQEPGYCVNRPATVPTSGEDSAAWKDLQFKDPQSGLTISGTDKDVATTNNAVSSITVTVKSFDYGAFGKLKAEAQIGGVWVRAFVDYPGETNPQPEFASVPRDLDNNTIADSWAHNNGAAADDADVSLNNAHNGDGLTRYDEYRGVDIDNDGKVADAERLNPDRKDLFAYRSGFVGWVPFGIGNAFNEAQIDVHVFHGTLGTDDRKIDVMLVSALNQGGHLEKRVVSRDWTWSTQGQSGVGTAVAYGGPGINKLANDYYFSDKPYKDGNTWTAAATWGDPPNGVLDPLTRVEDTNDNGVLDAVEKDGSTSPPPDDADGVLDGDHVVPNGATWNWGQDLNPMDIDNNSKVELPRASVVPVNAADESTKAQVVQHTITHEMGHGVGINGPFGGHCDDNTCLNAQSPENWRRDGHFCNDCRAMILIHND